MIYYTPQRRGFSLVEVLVSISILLLVMAGPMSLLTRANNSTIFASQQVNAWFLAQEGLELVEKRRDDLLLQHFADPISMPTPWARFASPPLNNPWAKCFDLAIGCGITISTGPNRAPVPIDCATGTNCRLYINSSRASYVHTAGAVPSPYTRVIKIEETKVGREVKVTSTVTWRTGSLIAEQKVEAITYLFNIYETS